jgi:hypothetical protein
MAGRSHSGEEAWARFQQEMAAKQEVLEWQAFIPLPVLEEENFFKAPGMAAWFNRGGNRAAILELPPWERNGPVTLAQLRAASEERRSNFRAARSVIGAQARFRQAGQPGRVRAAEQRQWQGWRTCRRGGAWKWSDQLPAPASSR